MIAGSWYLVLKPHLPWPLRMAVRRRWAAARRADSFNTWPIDPAAGGTPPNWPGWPEDKRFALVLTHDVESRKGVTKLKALMSLERQCGFRSAFNLVPEGDYPVSDALRENIESYGFEVGVHGLRHDGRLYSSKRAFAARACRINTYIADWHACGFRSPLMQHRLSWMHKLNVAYDCSTFDTDPFEMQPDGVRTIFPFWVPGPDANGFVELPYTLPQDFTLFITFREKNIDIWKRKLDWIAEHGGMALIDTHPDYMSFEGPPARDEYPVSHYEDFLSYVRKKYDGVFWSALPQDVARYYCSVLPASSRNTRRKICMLAYAYYKSDNRVRRYAETLTARGDQVDVIGLSHASEPLGAEQIRGVTSYRIQHRTRDEGNKWVYALRLLRFLVASSIFLTQRHHRIGYDVVHVHNVPDPLVFAAWYPKWTGTKLILDIHDIVPELFESKFATERAVMYNSLLKLSERASANFVDHVIISNHLWYEKLIARSAPKEKCSVFLNHVDPAIFYQHQRTRSDGKLIMVFPGTFQWHQGLDIAIKALALLQDQIPGAELHLYGSGSRNAEVALSTLAKQLGLAESVRFFGPIPLDSVPEVIANADFGVVPKRADSFGNEAYSTKIMEFMSQGVPVVASRTRIDTFYFDDTVVRYFPSGDHRAMAVALLQLIENRHTREAMIAKGHEYVDLHSWDREKADYLKLIDTLSTETLDGFDRAQQFSDNVSDQFGVR